MSDFGTRKSGFFGGVGGTCCVTSCGVEVLGSGACSTVRCAVGNNASGQFSAALGGQSNTASGDYSAIVGGDSNTSSGVVSFIGGGNNNTSSGYYSTVGGGQVNTSSGDYSFIGGGLSNTTVNQFSTISGGISNTSSGYASSIGGGSDNIASGCYSSVSGGYTSRACGKYSFIGGGGNNTITSSACYSAILGGNGNNVSGAYSGAFGCSLVGSCACTFYTNNHCACGWFYTSCIPNACAVCSNSGQLIGYTPTFVAGSYGSFYDTTTQNATINTPTPMKFNTTDFASGFVIQNNLSGNPTRIKATNAGKYNLQFSAQLNRTSGGNSEEVDIWLRINDNNVGWSNTGISLQANAGKLVASWNFFINLTAGQYVEIMWLQTDNIQILAEVAGVNYPETPSIIATINQIG